MVRKKLLTIHECHFSLPDDFEGTLGNALMLLANERLKAELNNKVDKANDGLNCYENLINNEDIKCSIEYTLCKLSEDGTKWEIL